MEYNIKKYNISTFFNKKRIVVKWLLILPFFYLLLNSSFSQSPYILRGDVGYHTYDRVDLLLRKREGLFNGINNYSRKELTSFLISILKDSTFTKKDKYDVLHILSDNLEFLDDLMIKGLNQNNQYNYNLNHNPTRSNLIHPLFNQKPILKHFYHTPSNFLQLESSSFSLFVNPILHIAYLNEVNNDKTIFQNTRGLEARGYIDQKVYFFMQLLENQRSFLSYVEDRIKEFGTLPGQGSIKKYESSFFKDLKGYDFFNTRAYFGFSPNKYLNLEFGHGNHFIGNGIKSLLLSDYSHNYLYLKSNFKFGKFHYQNIFLEASPPPAINSPGDRVLPKKYMTIHYLAFKPTTGLEIGLFESTVLKKQDNFKLQNLNPLILYRTFEHLTDKSNNVLLGLNLKWNAFKKFCIYGQILSNDFNPSEIIKKNGWWSKRIGTQIGVKYVNLLNIDHLDVQLEYNSVSPYTYSFSDTSAFSKTMTFENYSNFNQPLAHTLGANFKELIYVIRYRPLNRLYIFTKFINTVYGADKDGENWGGNILLPSKSRQMDFGNFIGQGERTTIKAINLDISYEIFHNYYFDFQAMWRQTKKDVVKDQHYIGGGLRVNIANLHYDY